MDYWSLGCLMYALLAARGPFTVIGGDTSDDNAATLNNDPDLSIPVFSLVAASLLKGLMQKDPKRRLGCGPSGVQEVMKHPFFAGVDWVAIETRQVPPPFKPTVNVLESGKAVRGWSEKDKAKLATMVVTPADQAKYRGIPFVSQKAIYKEIIQNMALREAYFRPSAAAAAAAAAAPGGGSGGYSYSSSAGSTSGGGGGGGSSRGFEAPHLSKGGSGGALAAGGASGAGAMASPTITQQQINSGSARNLKRRPSLPTGGGGGAGAADGPGKCSIM